MHQKIAAALIAASLTLLSAPEARAACWGVCPLGTGGFDTGERALALGATVTLGLVGLGVSGVHVAHVGDPAPYGALAAGAVSSSANLALGAVLLVADCRADQCGYNRQLAAISLGTGLVGAVTTIVLATREPTPGGPRLAPSVSFDGENAQLGLTVTGW